MSIELPKTKIYFPSLNGLRAISIILVIFSHLKWTNPGLRSFLYDYVPLLADGQVGVNIFFIISGFLITSLLIDEEKRSDRVSLKKFYMRRIIRIFPAYYFLLFFYFIVSLYGYVSISNASWFTALTYTKYFNWNLDLITGHLWSLSIEEHYYLLFPILFLFKQTRKPFVFLVILLAPIVRMYFFSHPNQYINELTFFYRMDSISMGCLFAFYKEQIYQKLKNNFVLVFYLSITLLVSMSYLTMLNIKYGLHLGFFTVPFGGTYGTFTNLFLTIIMFYSVFGNQGYWFKFLNYKLINFIGLLSYSLYLWQQFFLDNRSGLVHIFPINLVLIILCSLFSYYVIEQNFLKLRSRFIV